PLRNRTHRADLRDGALRRIGCRYSCRPCVQHVSVDERTHRAAGVPDARALVREFLQQYGCGAIRSPIHRLAAVLYRAAVLARRAEAFATAARAHSEQCAALRARCATCSRNLDAVADRACAARRCPPGGRAATVHCCYLDRARASLKRPHSAIIAAASM